MLQGYCLMAISTPFYSFWSIKGERERSERVLNLVQDDSKIVMDLLSWRG